MSDSRKIDRRSFLKTAGATGAGLALIGSGFAGCKSGFRETTDKKGIADTICFPLPMGKIDTALWSDKFNWYSYLSL